MAKWLRPSGNELETNDRPETIAHCIAQGWQRVDEVPDTDGDGDVSDESVSKMNAEQLKGMMAELGVEYTNKPEAIAYLKANGYD